MTHFEISRKNMVNSQLLPNAITSVELLEAFRGLKRENFVPVAQQFHAYIDRDLTLDIETSNEEKRFMLDPMIQAKLIQALNIKPTDIVLDVACATGYSTALIARIANMVVGIEADKNISEIASKHIEQQEINNAVIIHDPLTDGYVKEAPYDAILINGLIEQVPDELFDQLAENGRLITVQLADGSTNDTRLGHAYLYHKTNGAIAKRMVFDANSTKLNDFNKIVKFEF